MSRIISIVPFPRYDSTSTSAVITRGYQSGKK